MEINYKGTKWFKCDLHLHTPASKCFQDQAVTPEQWVERAIESGLQCVAITDHNTGFSIDAIKAAAHGKCLSVFPAVEITCDTSKIHLLILFDITKATNDINDFLIKCDIKRTLFGEQDAHTSINIFDVATIAYELGALVIPAHIDEYSGLGSVSVANLQKFYSLDYINAVQVVHKEFLNTALVTNGNTELKTLLNDYYNNPSIAIDDATVKEWFTPVKYAVEAKLAILTFSDNPYEPKNSKHGLAGIGTRHTWIKMDENPSLEGLRQAFLLPEFRVKNDFDFPGIPYEVPSLWIKSISITNCLITDTINPLKIEFSPQLTTIIGGRGSGKSSVLKFIRGLFNHTNDLTELPEILRDHNDFYKRTDGKPKKGVLNENTCIEMEFVRKKILYKFTGTNIINCSGQDIKIEKYEDGSSTWFEVVDEAFIDFFEFEHYSQKQIYEIAQEPNSLRQRIDKSIPGLDGLQNEREIIKRSFLERSTSIRTIQQQISGKGKLLTEIRDVEAEITLLQQSGIADLLIAKEKFSNEASLINKFGNEVSEKASKLDELIDTIKVNNIDYSTFDDTHKSELEPLSKNVLDSLDSIKSALETLRISAVKLKSDFDTSLDTTIWQAARKQNALDFHAKKLELEEQGINSISNFEALSQSKIQKDTELAKINEIESSLSEEINDRVKLKTDFLNKSKEITDKRREFITTVLPAGKVKISTKPFRNQNDFIQKIRKAIQRDDTFQSDIEYLTSLCFNGNVEHNINLVREVFLKIRRGEQVNEVTKPFVNLVASMNDAQIDEIEMLLPEDEIEVQYKTSGTSAYRSLSTASAGQKTTAILTFILSYGNIPLILYQPEDDLDNRLVYELVVDKLRESKEQRQIIVVTHNANIPVNGDAELIISLNSESKLLEILHTGTVEQLSIKKEICDVMEGGEQAFGMRSKRYLQVK